MMRNYWLKEITWAFQRMNSELLMVSDATLVTVYMKAGFRD